MEAPRSGPCCRGRTEAAGKGLGSFPGIPEGVNFWDGLPGAAVGPRPLAPPRPLVPPPPNQPPGPEGQRHEGDQTGLLRQRSPRTDATLCGPLTRLRGPSITSIDPEAGGGLGKGSDGAEAHGGEQQESAKQRPDGCSSPRPGSQPREQREQQPHHFLLRRRGPAPCAAATHAS